MIQPVKLRRMSWLGLSALSFKLSAGSAAARTDFTMPAIVKPHSISWTEVFKRTWKEADEDDVFGRSAQLAYYFFLALFPLLIFVIAVLGVFAGKEAHVQDAVLDFLA